MTSRIALAGIAALGLFAAPALIPLAFAQQQVPYPPGPPAAPLPPSALAPPNTPNGARPGNEIGTGSSLPYSNAASNIDQRDTSSVLAPNLPSPPLGENASPRDYLVAARNALAAGRTGEAQQSLEMAETRTLDRSVAYDATMQPDDSRFIQMVRDALHALANGDRGTAISVIEQAMPLARS
jgi:hypothetical protein